MVRGQWANLARMPGLWEISMGFFRDHGESGLRFNVSSEGRCFLRYSVPIHYT